MPFEQRSPGNPRVRDFLGLLKLALLIRNKWGERAEAEEMILA